MSVHACRSSRLDFLARNFDFKTMPFATMIERIFEQRSMSTRNNNNNTTTTTTDNNGVEFDDDFERLYLRSVGANPRRDISNVWLQVGDLMDRRMTTTIDD